MLARDLLHLSSSSRSLRVLGLQLLPQRLRVAPVAPFALLSRAEKAEVLRFLPVMEVGMGDFGWFQVAKPQRLDKSPRDGTSALLRVLKMMFTS